MKRIVSLISMLTAAMCLTMEAKVSLPSILSDGMVLQRDKPICIWGNADSRESFIICWQGKSHIIESGEDGTWSAELPECGPGGPYEMTIGDIVLKDILVGDVFLCSGQSNMELPVRRVMCARSAVGSMRAKSCPKISSAPCASTARRTSSRFSKKALPFGEGAGKAGG